MSLDFCAIDFETANAFRGSPCAVGLARVVDGQIVETRRLLMQPPEGYDSFDPFNIWIHGITPDMVKGQPRFAQRLPEILAFACGLPLVAHNAAFDIGVIRDACDASGIGWPTLSYACTLVLSRRTYDLLSYALPWVAEAAGVTLEDHHDPSADATCDAGIMLAIAAARSASCVDEVLTACHCTLGELSPDRWGSCRHLGLSGSIVPLANHAANPTHPFFGQEMVFTGTLASMTRECAWELVAERGGQPAPGVTKHTNILVMGYQDVRVLRPGETLSAKARKASELRACGQRIELLGEEDFVQLLEL